MLYYEVLPEFDQKRKNPLIANCNIYIAYELYTEKEVIKENLKLQYLQNVNYSKHNTYWFYGVRFNSEQNKKRGL